MGPPQPQHPPSGSPSAPASGTRGRIGADTGGLCWPEGSGRPRGAAPASAHLAPLPAPPTPRPPLAPERLPHPAPSPGAPSLEAGSHLLRSLRSSSSSWRRPNPERARECAWPAAPRSPHTARAGFPQARGLEGGTLRAAGSGRRAGTMRGRGALAEGSLLCGDCGERGL